MGNVPAGDGYTCPGSLSALVVMSRVSIQRLTITVNKSANIPSPRTGYVDYLLIKRPALK